MKSALSGPQKKPTTHPPGNKFLAPQTPELLLSSALFCLLIIKTRSFVVARDLLIFPFFRCVFFPVLPSCRLNPCHFFSLLQCCQQSPFPEMVPTASPTRSSGIDSFCISNVAAPFSFRDESGSPPTSSNTWPGFVLRVFNFPSFHSSDQRPCFSFWPSPHGKDRVVCEFRRSSFSHGPGNPNHF